jgi:hypothetical protein
MAEQMKRVLLDTGAWISAYAQRKDLARVDRAKRVLEYLERNPTRYTVCYSQRTQIELSGHAKTKPPDLSRFVLLPYHSGNETWGEIDTTWGDAQEVAAGDSLLKALPEKKKKTNQRDRGIYGDAAFEKCNIVLHENPDDFSRFAAHAEASGILLINLLKHTPEEIIRMLES